MFLYDKVWTLAGPAILELCAELPIYYTKWNYDKYQRHKRSTRQYFVGRIRGQTQSQYLNYGGGQEPGKAEAESTVGGSRAVVCEYETFLYYQNSCHSLI